MAPGIIQVEPAPNCNSEETNDEQARDHWSGVKVSSSTTRRYQSRNGEPWATEIEPIGFSEKASVFESPSVIRDNGITELKKKAILHRIRREENSVEDHPITVGRMSFAADTRTGAVRIGGERGRPASGVGRTKERGDGMIRRCAVGVIVRPLTGDRE